MVSCLDTVDRALMQELAADCRKSYQAIARKLNLAPNTVRNRMNKLREQGVLLGFDVFISMEMMGAEHVAGYVLTDGAENVIEFMKRIATHPGVAEIYRTGDMRYEYWAIVSGASEALGFERFLQNLDDVKIVELRPIEFLFPNMPPEYFMNSRGKKVIFTKSQLQVLRYLFDNGRMPVSQIAQSTGFTARRVRKILRELKEGGGVHFHGQFDIFKLGGMEYRLKIRYDGAQISGQEIITGIYNKYPIAFWWASITTNEPLVDIGLIINSPGAAVPIINEVKSTSYSQLVEDYVTYPRVVKGNAPPRVRLAEILIEAGLLDSDARIWGSTGGNKISEFLQKKENNQF